MNNLRGVLYAVVSSATFGLIPLFSIPLLQGGMSSPAILFYRFGLAAAMMGLIALATGGRFVLRGRKPARCCFWVRCIP